MSMRVTDSQMAHILIQDNHRSLARMLRLQRMASSLRRVNSYADDPVAVGAINRYRNLLKSNNQYLRNAERARAFVDATDQALLSVQDVLKAVLDRGKVKVIRVARLWSAPLDRRAARTEVKSVQMNARFRIISGHERARISPGYGRRGPQVRRECGLAILVIRRRAVPELDAGWHRFSLFSQQIAAPMEHATPG